VTIAFVSLEPWDSIWRRNQFVCDALLRYSFSNKILFVQPPHDNSHALRTLQVANLRIKPTIVAGGYEDRLQLYTPTKWLPSSLNLGRTLNENLFTWQLRKAFSSLGWDPTHLWINQHQAAHLLNSSIAPVTIYDITDDWTKFSGNQAHHNIIVKQDYDLCSRSSQVIVCSQQLLADKAKIVDKSRLHIVPNGVHIDHYKFVCDTAIPTHPITRDWKTPVIGYTGTIHGDRVDVNLVGRVASAYPDSTIALVGPNLLTAQELAELNKHSNIVIAGPQPYHELPDIMRAFDVCIVPHLVTPFTESLNPIKLWEYLASGKPIASTNVAGFRDFPNVVNVAAFSDEFLNAIDRALREKSERSRLRQEIAKDHSWAKRIEQVVKILRVDT
jgi:teichuronic acid biosynthesis glycosyltransferase TuaH